MTGPDDDDLPEDQPEELPEVRNVADAREERKRRRAYKVSEREQVEFLQKALADPAGRRFLWGILQACGTFEERIGHVNGFAAVPEQTWAFRGQRDLGIQIYHNWSITDRAGVLSMLDEYHPQFPKLKKPKAK